MDTVNIIQRDFYLRQVQAVARDLLGQRLVRIIDGERIAGIICETEAYDGEQDLACHARSGKTQRNRVMYEQGGLAYVYFTYGMHWMLNCVCGPAGYPAAVLIRAIVPSENLTYIRQRRAGIAEKHWTDGPAKLTKALAIDGNLNGSDLCRPESGLFIEPGLPIPDESVQTSARIGIQYAGEPWTSKPWRFYVQAEAIKSRLGI